ncbi:MAG: indolepyruvate oxidoreductase subunit beta [Clostridia bacterium]|nr:indolepyruvate oxidoreductase subunit beta [Clostridia bacterium]
MDILIAGVGGQGTLLASRVLGKYAGLVGLDVKLSEVHGMAQRGGSVITFVRMGQKVNSPIIDFGGADVVLAFEKLEALRYAHYLKTDGKTVYSTQEIMPMPVVTGAAEYPQDIESRLKNPVKIDAMKYALLAGNAKAANSVMIGFLTKVVGFDHDAMKQALSESVPQKLLEMNQNAFELGYRA